MNGNIQATRPGALASRRSSAPSASASTTEASYVRFGHASDARTSRLKVSPAEAPARRNASRRSISTLTSAPSKACERSGTGTPSRVAEGGARSSQGRRRLGDDVSGGKGVLSETHESPQTARPSSSAARARTRASGASGGRTRVALATGRREALASPSFERGRVATREADASAKTGETRVATRTAAAAKVRGAKHGDARAGRRDMLEGACDVARGDGARAECSLDARARGADARTKEGALPLTPRFPSFSRTTVAADEQKRLNNEPRGVR